MRNASTATRIDGVKTLKQHALFVHIMVAYPCKALTSMYSLLVAWASCNSRSKASNLDLIANCLSSQVSSYNKSSLLKLGFPPRAADSGT